MQGRRSCAGGTARLYITGMLLFCGTLFAQFTTARLNGTVMDASGAVVPGAAVKAANDATGFAQTATTDSSGSFLFPRLPVGAYRLTVEKPGFVTWVHEGITLTVDQSASERVVLAVGASSQNVTVTGNTEVVDTSTSTLGQLVGSRQIMDLPLDGRTVQSLVFLAPGSTDVSDNYCGLGCQGGVYPGEQYAAVHGGGPNGVNYQLDGASHNDTYLNMNLPFPNPDAVEEFNLQTNNMSAEYGNAVSGVVNIVTKSGTNSLHGSLFEYLRNGTLNARNFFAPTHDELKRNQFGGALGGPVVKDKLFYFGTYQGTRIRVASQGDVAFVPTEAERRGDFSALLPDTQLVDPITQEPFAGNLIPAERLSPVTQYLLQHMPLPNGPNRQLTFNGPSTIQNEDQFMIKLDYNRGKHQTSGRFFYTDFREPPITPSAANILQARSTGTEVSVKNFVINHTFSATPRLLFNTWFSWNRQSGGTRSSAPFSFPDAGVKTAAPKIPELVVGVGSYFFLNTNHYGQNTRGDWTIRESVTRMIGAHELHIGGEAMRISAPQQNQYLQNGEWFFSDDLSGDTMADFLLGRASNFQQGGGIFLDLIGTKWSAFVQDNWKASSRLTVNLGVRWDPNFPYTERNGRTVCFEPGKQSVRYPNAPLGLLYGGSHPDTGCPRTSMEVTATNLAPRVGFAYRLTEDGKTSIRGGAGIYYMPPETVTYQDVAGVAPFGPILELNDVEFSDPYGSAGIPNPFPAHYGPRVPGPDTDVPQPVTIFGAFAQDFKLPRIVSWNLTVERELFKDFVLRTAYVGNKGTHLYGSTDQKPLHQANPAVYIPGQSTVGNTQERRLYPEFGLVGIIDAWNNSNYNAFEVTLERRFARGFQILANYTWAKALDDFGPTNNFAGTNPFDRRFDYGRSDDDIPHQLKLSGIWQIPHLRVGRPAGAVLNGWQVNSIVSWRSGFPFTVVSGLDNSFSGAGWGPQDRADFLGGNAQLSGRSHDQMIAEYFDTSKFVPNAPGTFGSSGKNVLRGPRFFKTDLSLIKSFKIGERIDVQFRAEAFNVFNNVNFGGPDATQSDSSFGQITWARDPRILQAALRFAF